MERCHEDAKPKSFTHARDRSLHREQHSEEATMCRNITILRGLQPPATAEEIQAAARQYVRKVSGATRPPVGAEGIFEEAVAEVAAVTTRLLHELPARRNPPAKVPPLRLHGHP
jgi:hypothetical protein